MNDSLLVTHELTKRYGSMLALNRCSLTVHAGQVFGLLGPNGAGKTTLIRTLLGYLEPTSGWGKILGLDCQKQSVQVRSRVAYLPGDARLFRQMRGREVLDFFLAMRPGSNRSRCDELARRLDLDLSRRVVFMSTGMRQKLALVAVLTSQTSLVILDEPTANLDPTVRAEVLQLVREAQQQGQTVLFSSHVLSEIEEVCDEVAILRKGELVHRLKLVDLRQSHRIHCRTIGGAALDKALQETAVPNITPRSDIQASASQLSAIRLTQTQPDQWMIDIDGDLQPYLGLLSKLPLEQVRIEPRGLESVYQEFHPPTTARTSTLHSTTLHSTTWPNSNAPDQLPPSNLSQGAST